MSIEAMKAAVTQYMNKAVEQAVRARKAQRGIVRGNSVVIGNRCYPYYPAVDVYFKDGDDVWAIVDDSCSQAVVVGN